MAYPQNYLGDAVSSLPRQIEDFYFLRHGKTSWNDQHLVQGGRDIPLNDIGKQQAKEAGEELAGLPIQRIVSSPLSRASETATLATKELNLQIHLDNALKERDYGTYEGKPAPEGLYRNDFDTCELRQKFSRRVAEAMAHCSTTGTLIVSHGGVLRVILALLQTDVQMQEHLDNARVLHFKKIGSGWRVIALQTEKFL